MSGASASRGRKLVVTRAFAAPETTSSGFTYRSVARPVSVGPVFFGLPAPAAPVDNVGSEDAGSTTEVDSESQRGKNQAIVVGMWAESAGGAAQVGGGEEDGSATDADSESQRGKNDAIVASWGGKDDDGEEDESVTDADSESQRGKNDALVALWAGAEEEDSITDADSESQRGKNDAIVARWAAGITPGVEPATIADNYTMARDFAYPASHALHTAHPLASGGPGLVDEVESEAEEDVEMEEVEAEVEAEEGANKRKREPEVLASNTRVKVGPDRTATRKSLFPTSSLVRRRVTKMNLGGRKPAGLIPDLLAGVILAPPNDKAAMSDPEKKGGVDHMRPRLGFAADGRLYPASAVPVERPCGVERIRNRQEERMTRARRTSSWVNSGACSVSPRSAMDGGNPKGRTGRVRGGRVEKSTRITPARRFEPEEYPRRVIGESHLEGLRRYVTSHFGKSPAIMVGTNVLSGVGFFPLSRLNEYHTDIFRQSLAPGYMGVRGVEEREWRIVLREILLKWLGMEVEL